MRSTHFIASLLIGAFATAPFAVFAEETVATDPTTGAPVPTLYQQRETPPAQLRNQRIATGTRMMASGTRPISKTIETRMEARDAQMEKLRSNCVLADGTVASRTDCATLRQERREEVRERITERRGEALRSLANVLIKRLEAALARETKLADRIDSRIVKLKANGVVTTEAEAKIAIARTKMTEAQTAVTAAKTQIDSAVTTANATGSTTAIKDAGKEVREQMQVAREALVAAHKALVAAVESLKANIKVRTTTEATASTSAQ